MSFKGQNINLSLAFLSIISLLLAAFLNFYRYEFFGVIHGYAPHNFGFNMTIFIPLTMVSILSGIFAVSWVLMQWKIRPNRKIKILTIIFSIPAIIELLLLLFFIFHVIKETNI